jgi:hypothetical protein
LRRVIFARAVRTASSLVAICFGCAALVFRPAVGSACIGIAELSSNGWVFIGPVVGLRLGISDNAHPAVSFNWKR